MVLQCSAFPGHFPNEEEYSHLAFNFWYVLQDEIANADVAKSAGYLIHFVPVYQNLVGIFLRKACRAPESDFASWDRETKERFSNYRYQRQYIEIYNILRWNWNLYF